ncbi:MAG: GNAT family N-acetyltransferase [Chloroflexota bacterium]
MAIRRAAVKIEIRPLAEDEIPILEQQLRSGPVIRHRQRYQLQEEGEGYCLVAWHDGSPVGHGVINWSGAPDEPMASQLLECPDIEDLFVLPEYRSRGIGSQLLAALEDLARRFGYSKVGLGVATDNVRAWKLYLRQGYADSGFGVYPHYTTYVDDQGRTRARTESCVYLIKELA